MLWISFLDYITTNIYTKEPIGLASLYRATLLISLADAYLAPLAPYFKNLKFLDSKNFFKIECLSEKFFIKIKRKEVVNATQMVIVSLGHRSGYTSLLTLLKKNFFFKNLLASSGVIVSKLDAELSATPGITGAIDPSPFYLLPSYKSCEDLARMAKNADYYKGPWPSYLKYKLYKEWEIRELEAYKAKFDNILNSSPLENNIISDKILIMYDSIIQMPEPAIFIFILALVGFGYILLSLCHKAFKNFFA